MDRTTYLHEATYESKTFRRSSAGANYRFCVVRVHTDAARAAVHADLDREIAAQRAIVAKNEPRVAETRKEFEKAAAAHAWWTAKVDDGGRYGGAPEMVERWLLAESGLTGPVIAQARKLGFMPAVILSDGGSYNSQRGIYSGLDVVTTTRKNLEATPQGAIDAANVEIANLEARKVSEDEGALGAESAAVVGWCSRADLAAKLASKTRAGHDKLIVLSGDDVKITKRTGKARERIQ